MAYNERLDRTANLKLTNTAMPDAIKKVIKKTTPRWTNSEKRSLRNLFALGYKLAITRL